MPGQATATQANAGDARTAASTTGQGVHRGWLVTGLLLLILAGGALVYSVAPSDSGPAVTVTGAYVREPASVDVASAYFTVVNHTHETLTLTSVSTASAASAHVMTENAGAMTDSRLTVPGHGKGVLKPNAAHLMLESPRGVTTGRTVRLTLTFDHGVSVQVDAKVVGLLDPAPKS